MFKVVQDQLRVSEGWVRCGHCDHVFDAKAHFIDANGMSLSMMDRAAPPPPPAPPPVAVTAPAFAPAPAVRSVVAPAWVAPPGPSPSPAVNAPSNVAEAFAPQRSAPDMAPSAAAVPSPEPALFTTGLLTSQPDVAHVASVASPPDGAPFLHEGPLLDADGTSGVTMASVGGDSEPAFLQAPVTPAPERSGRVVWAILAALFLLLLLVGQIVVQERNRIAAASPMTKPALQWLCDVVACNMGAVQKLDALVIESSAFNKVRGDLYKLALSVRNTSDVEVAMPAVELTVTDIQDQAVMRKVLHPLDLGVTRAVLPPGRDWSGSMVVSLSAASLPARVMGYHIEVFYP